jgi:nogalonic acid methyl ester cyclase/aklanonic acid methyl ester cyclase
MSAVKEENIRVVRLAFEVFNTGDFSKVHEFISPNFLNHESEDHPVRKKLRGPEESMETVKSLRNAFANLHFKEEEIIATDDQVVSRVVTSGKHTGDLFGIPPTG